MMWSGSHRASGTGMVRRQPPPWPTSRSRNGDGVQHLVNQLELRGHQNAALSDEQTNLLSVAKESLRASRMATQKLLDSISLSDLYSLVLLGSILNGLKDSEQEICGLPLPENAHFRG